MTLYDFKQMDADEQAATVWELGQYVSDRMEEPMKYLLYKIDGFFAEVWYNSNQNRIISIRTFRHGKFLDAYFDLN